MELRIGIVDSNRELELELDEASDQDAVAEVIEKALAAGEGVYWVVDRRGRKLGIPVQRIAYVEIGPDRNQRKVGFSA
jgi:hypothetical protein